MNQSKLLADKTVLITGGIGGIGYYTARALAALGATLYITGRDTVRGQQAEKLTGQTFESSTRSTPVPAEMCDPALQEKAWELADSLAHNAPAATSPNRTEIRTANG